MQAWIVSMIVSMTVSMNWTLLGLTGTATFTNYLYIIYIPKCMSVSRLVGPWLSGNR